ncbi:hypothetical protein GH714_034018 [Hevea brasiliensis]|uniref:Uncharacterized protein n=1 Tax=Hevea brasiliensis TaxID=3981 RepID=A0A6A6K842_HEVBR|nr:hypothetical protein GH714_034018 [Hevea brasiliensis]
MDFDVKVEKIRASCRLGGCSYCGGKEGGTSSVESVVRLDAAALLLQKVVLLTVKMVFVTTEGRKSPWVSKLYGFQKSDYEN